MSQIRRSALVGVSLGGGLGNQMFQYAAGLSLAAKLGAELRCNSYHFSKQDTRSMDLREFGLTWTECRNPSANGALRAIARRVGLAPQSKPFHGALYLEEEFGRFDPRFNTLTAPCYLNGHFQSWRYFEGREPIVRLAFDLGKISGHNLGSTERQIRAARHPVAIHVRRGDYTNPNNAAFHGLLGKRYYDLARSEIEARVESPTYFLFSDDPAAAAAELGQWPNLIVVGGHSTHEDLKLMAMCEHFVIANSTFSWWGAWLGAAPSKMVVAPEDWFAPAHAQSTLIDDRYPHDWIRV